MTGMKASKQKLLFKGVLSDTAQVWLTIACLIHEGSSEETRPMRRYTHDRYNRLPVILLAVIGHGGDTRIPM